MISNCIRVDWVSEDAKGNPVKIRSDPVTVTASGPAGATGNGKAPASDDLGARRPA